MSEKRINSLVSVVVSNYNNEKYIEQCLESLIRQTYKNIEIIVVDDASTDNSVEVIEEWIKSDKNTVEKQKKVILLKLPRNVGFSGAVTAGLFLTHGEYIAMQDGDDYSDEKRIEKQVKYLNEHTDIKAVGSNYAVFTDDQKRPKIVPNFLRYGKEEIREVYSQGGTAVSYGTLLFDAKIFDNVGGLTRRIEGAEDYEYITKMLNRGVDNIKVQIGRAHV